MFGLDARLEKIEQRFLVKGMNEIYCHCSDAREKLFLKLCPEGDHDFTCREEIHNPRPESKIEPVMDRRKVINILLGPDWEDREIQNIAEEAGPDLLLQPQLEILEKIKPELKPTGDHIRDSVAARLLENRELNREELAKKLLVPTNQGQDD